MAYLIYEPCIGTEDTSCVEVCPVDCIEPTAEEAGFDEADRHACIERNAAYYRRERI